MPLTEVILMYIDVIQVQEILMSAQYASVAEWKEAVTVQCYWLWLPTPNALQVCNATYQDPQ